MAEEMRKTPRGVAEIDVEHAKALEELADAVVEDLKGGYQSDFEPFEAYAERVRADIHTSMGDFHKRFLQGYQVLLEELTKQYSSKDEEEKPPPGAMII